MWSYYASTMRYLNGLNPQEWLLALGVVVVVGMVCLKGFGSRTSY